MCEPPITPVPRKAAVTHCRSNEIPDLLGQGLVRHDPVQAPDGQVFLPNTPGWIGDPRQGEQNVLAHRGLLLPEELRGDSIEKLESLSRVGVERFEQGGGVQRLRQVAELRWRGVIDTIDPVEQEKHLKYNHLVANAAAIQNVIDLTRAVRDLQADGYFVRREDLTQLSPYQTRRLKRFGDYTLSMGSPDPFDTDLVVPFPLEDAQESAATA